MTESKTLAHDVRKRANKVQRSRSKAAVEMDNRKNAKRTFKNPTEEQYRRWARSPNKYDIEGVDNVAGTSRTPKKGGSAIKTLPKKQMKDPDDEYAEYMSMCEDYVASKTPYNEDMRALLKDDAHEEIARNSRWKWNDRDTVKEYLAKKRGDQAVYNKKRKPRNNVRNKTVLDTCVISSGIGKRDKGQLKAIRVATHRDVNTYIEGVDNELKAYPKKNRDEKRRIEQYRKEHKTKIVKTTAATDDELQTLPAKRKDKRILDESSKSNAKTIVTLDKDFVRKANGYRGIDVESPKKYIDSKKKKRRY